MTDGHHTQTIGGWPGPPPKPRPPLYRRILNRLSARVKRWRRRKEDHVLRITGVRPDNRAHLEAHIAETVRRHRIAAEAWSALAGEEAES